MTTSQSKTPPTFDRGFLLELAGGVVYKQAETLFETGAVTSVEWESPVLTGVVKAEGEYYKPKLNLRSTVFTQNNCNCIEGRRRKMCAHAIAIALHYEALKQEKINAAEFQSELIRDVVEPEEPQQTSLNSIKLSAEGDKLRVLVFLPPNLESASQQDAVVVKLDAAVGREIVPLNHLSPARSYAPAEPHLAALFMDADRILSGSCPLLNGTIDLRELGSPAGQRLLGFDVSRQFCRQQSCLEQRF